jgi:hypothetical protein
MSEDLKDILSHLNPDIDQETLLLYLQGKLSPDKQHEVEKRIMDNEFESDAVEGLQDIRDKKNISVLIGQLNQELKKRTEKKKRFRQKLKLQLEPWLVIALIMILLLAVISFIIVYRKLHP